MSDIAMPEGVTRKVDTNKLLKTLAEQTPSVIEMLETLNINTKGILNFSKEQAQLQKDFQKEFLEPINSLVENEEDDKPKMKRVPTVTDVLKKGDIGAIYLGNILLDILDKKEEEEKGEGFFSKILGGLGTGIGMTGVAAMGKKLLGTIAKGGAIMAIVGGIIWATLDGIAAIGEAENWGVSKVEAFIGGFFAGTGSGWKNAFKNAGKWALIGVGAGFLIGGPVGALVGGLLGAAIGGILGYIGGEKVAKAMKAIGKAFANFWEDLKNDFITFWRDLVDLGTELKEFGQTIWDGILIGLSAIGTFFTDVWSTTVDVVGIVKTWINESILTPIGNFFTGIWTSIDEATEGALTKVTGWINDAIIQPIGEFFGKIGLGIAEFFGLTPEAQEEQTEAMKARVEETAPLREAYLESMKAQQELGRGGYYGMPTKVDDAIIKPDGTIIHTSPDDTIIATKNNPVLDREMARIAQPNNINGLSSIDLVNSIKELVDTLKKVGSVRTVVQTNNIRGLSTVAFRNIPL